MKHNFQLVTYQRRCIFQFKQLPLSIKELIEDKIKERNAGLYANIPEFNTNNDIETEEIELQSDLYSGDTIFYIYNEGGGSADANANAFGVKGAAPLASPLPGKGMGEQLDRREISKYEELNHYENWRAKLSNECVQPFILHERKYQSVISAIKDEKDIEDAIYAKFSQNKNLQTILKHTKNAKLLYFVPKCAPITATTLMKVRKYLS